MPSQAAPALRPFLEDLAAGRGPAAPAGADPALLAALVHWHGLSGLAGRAIQAGRVSLPPEAASRILADWSAARRWAGLLDLEVQRVARAVREGCGGFPDPGAGGAAGAARGRAGARPLSPPILLKGPTVARRYRDPAVRPYADVDVLVPAEELDAWGSALRGLGYRGPGPWEERDGRRYREHVVYRRPVGGRDLPFEVHWCLFTERRARRLDHRTLAAWAVPGPWPGLLQPAPQAHLVVLAVHLAHHGPERRRLIWLRDFLELGDRGAVEGARALAAAAGVEWALERALRATEELAGEPRWGAAPRGRQPFGLARVREVRDAGHLQHLATMWELGPWGGVGYLLSRLDPRRFRHPGGGFDLSAVRAWTARVAAGARATPWLGRGWAPSRPRGGSPAGGRRGGGR